MEEPWVPDDAAADDEAPPNEDPPVVDELEVALDAVALALEPWTPPTPLWPPVVELSTSYSGWLQATSNSAKSGRYRVIGLSSFDR